MTNVPISDIAEQVRSVMEMANSCSSEGPAMVSISAFCWVYTLVRQGYRDHRP
jgi:hypothetical protein